MHDATERLGGRASDKRASVGGCRVAVTTMAAPTPWRNLDDEEDARPVPSRATPQQDHDFLRLDTPDFLPHGEVSLYSDSVPSSPALAVTTAAPPPMAAASSSSSSSQNNNNNGGDRSIYNERREFERAVNYATPAIEEAHCLASPEAALGLITHIDARGELVLSYDDWFKLRGLLLCARFGACEEKWPPYYDNRALRHWQAWKAQGSLPAREARQQFVRAAGTLPGYAEHGAAYAPIACWIVVCPCAWPFRLNICGVVAIRFERAAPRTPTLEEAEASRRRALLRNQRARGPPGTLESFGGRWKHVHTEGIDEYLKAFGVGVLRRKAAKVRAACACACCVCLRVLARACACFRVLPRAPPTRAAMGHGSPPRWLWLCARAATRMLMCLLSS